MLKSHENDDPPKREYELKDMTYGALKESFSKHESWNDLQDESSDLV